jgi:predicted nuclease of predicted toxin-antitoxin system
MGKIRVYTDESVSVAIAEGLRRRGIDAFTALEAGSLGLTDEEQLIYAKKEKAIIFTHDTDFLKISEEWTEGGRSHNGVVYCHQSMYSIG